MSRTATVFVFVNNPDNFRTWPQKNLCGSDKRIRVGPLVSYFTARRKARLRFSTFLVCLVSTSIYSFRIKKNVYCVVKVDFRQFYQNSKIFNPWNFHLFLNNDTFKKLGHLECFSLHSGKSKLGRHKISIQSVMFIT